MSYAEALDTATRNTNTPPSTSHCPRCRDRGTVYMVRRIARRWETFPVYCAGTEDADCSHAGARQHHEALDAATALLGDVENKSNPGYRKMQEDARSLAARSSRTTPGAFMELNVHEVVQARAWSRKLGAGLRRARIDHAVDLAALVEAMRESVCPFLEGEPLARLIEMHEGPPA